MHTSQHNSACVTYAVFKRSKFKYNYKIKILVKLSKNQKTVFVCFFFR